MSRLKPSHRLVYFLLRSYHLAHKQSNEAGYAMVVVSVVTIMLFSLMVAYLTITNITKAATNAYTEGNSTFYASESGLNARANMVRQKFIDYATPNGVSPGQVTGVIVGPENMAFCLDADTANDGSGDFACQRQALTYNQSFGADLNKSGDGKSIGTTEYNKPIRYTAYTFTSDRTVYTDPVRRIPQVQPIPSGQVFAGLNAQEYTYTIYSLATSRKPGELDARATTVLEMSFKSRSIPLFQFAAFYDGDLEMNSTSQMDIKGRVHTNANLYIQPTPSVGATDTTRLLGRVTAANSIYNRVDASTINRFGTTRVLITGNADTPNDAANVYEPFPAYDVDRYNPLTSTEIATFQRKVLDGAAGASVLRVPQPGFLRKRDADGEIGEYYGKADLRLEMMPKRAAGTVPFNFQVINEGGSGGSCTSFNLSNGRQGGTSLKCATLNEGQLRSLQQPVMVRVTNNEERDRFDNFCPTLTVNFNSSSSDNSEKLRALQVAISAQNTPVTLNQLNLPLSNTTNASISSIATRLKSLGSSDLSKSPAQLAGEMGGCFLAPPIQTVTTANGVTNGSGTNSNYNWTSGHYDRRENRWIGMLQTNIASLTVWNRDGIYVSRDNDLDTDDLTTNAQQDAAFNAGSYSAASSYDTNNLLFVRAAAKATSPTGSFLKLGLGSSDNTEGGLVFHATVSDDLDGNGTNDLNLDTTDNLRQYPGYGTAAEGKRKSPYGFVFNGGEDLPAPLTVVTDRALYLQGDYNNYAANVGKLPAATIGDTITVLSNECRDTNTGMVNCGITSGQKDASSTTVNAAFLSYTDASRGNSTGTSSLATPKSYSGGLNNYMRMVEDWDAKTFSYAGSFVSLGTPQEYSGAYVSGGSGGYYKVPIRNFQYESNFDAFDRLPPLTPKVIYLQQDVFKRSYR